MNNKLIALALIILTSTLGIGQSKKDLRSTVLRLQSDSTSQDKRLTENTALISRLTSENSEIKDLNLQLNKQLQELTLEHNLTKTTLKDSIAKLKTSINGFNEKLDSLNRYSRIIHFVNTFYKSLEFSEEENQRQYEFGNVKFDLENFNSLISKDARYSLGRVKNLSDEKQHQKYYIELQSIEEIKFSLNRVLIKTKVMYTGDKMGLFYNEEQLTLAENKGLLKLTDWVDLDLYHMMPSMEATVENFTREDFYRWLDGRSK